MSFLLTISITCSKARDEMDVLITLITHYNERCGADEHTGFSFSLNGPSKTR